MKWIEANKVDWDLLVSSSDSVVVYGIRKSLMDEFFKTPTHVYGCGYICSFGENEITLESPQGSISFLIKNIEKVLVL